MSYKMINSLNLQDKTVLLRADLNVPVQNGSVSDFARIDRLKPTIDHLLKHNCKVVIISHFGRPKGEINPEFTLSFLPATLEKQWGHPVCFAEDCIGEKAQTAINDLQNGEIILLENLRFHSDEEKNAEAFASELAKLADIYINDAFSASHRAHASIAGITKFMPSVAGLLIQEELQNLETTLNTPEKPMAAVVGGAKISTKLSLLKSLVQKVDYLILGGGMANTFLLARGIKIGKSLSEPNMVGEALMISELADQHGCTIVLPIDVNSASEFSENARHEIQPTGVIDDDMMVLDIGPESIQNVKEILKTCKTVIWNGPMGAFEIKPFDIGTNELAKVVAELTQNSAVKSIAGGGDTIAALDGTDSSKHFTYISTAGGAFLEWLEGKTLPGIAALQTTTEAA